MQRLIGGEVSLYTGKVRTYLRYKRIPFEQITATRDVYQNIILPRTGVRFIPVLITDDDRAIQDSTAIIDHLEARHPVPSIYPETPLQRLSALLLEVYADEWLVIPAMHYRWNVAENRTFAIEEFGRLSMPELAVEEQRAIGEKLAAPFAGALPALGVHPENTHAIERSYLELLAELDQHLSAHPYALGGAPCIADFALYGPLYAHLYRDPASGRLMKEHAPRVFDWVERMTSPPEQRGAFLGDDVVPKTLLPVLARMFREQGPVLASTLERLAAHAASATERKLPRALGRHEFALHGVQATRAIYPFNIWRWQRPHTFYQSLTGGGRERARELLERVGGLALMERAVTPLRREDNQLMLA